MNRLKMLASALSLSLLLSVSTLADAGDELGSRGALYVSYEEGLYSVTQNITGDYGAELSEGLSEPKTGEVYTIGGIRLQCGAAALDAETGLGNSGLIINSRTDGTTPVELGGEAEFYKAPDKRLYNTVIVLETGEEETETGTGAGLYYAGSSLRMRNTYIESYGAERPAVYVPASAEANELVASDCVFVGHETAALRLGGGSLRLLDAKAFSETEGAVLFENETGNLCLVNSQIQLSGTGAAIDLGGNAVAEVCGSELMGGETAVVLRGDALLTAGALDTVSAEAAAFFEGESALTEPDVTEGETRIIAYDNPLVICADSADPTTRATARLTGVYLSSLGEDIDFENDGVYPGEDAEAEFTSGDCVLIKSHCGQVVFDGCELHSRSGVLVRTVYAYDENASGIYPRSDADYVGDEIVFRSMTAEGDILHQDYMRKMTLSLENAALTGRVVSETLRAWNDRWEAIAPELVRDTEYETVLGVCMTLDAESLWCVTGRSSLARLTLAEGAQVTAPEGMSLVIYVDCPMSNDRESYDITAGRRVTELSPGVEYSGVVLLVQDPKTAGLSLDEDTLAAIGVMTEETEAGYEISVGGLLDMLGADMTFDEETGTVTVTDDRGILDILFN